MGFHYSYCRLGNLRACLPDADVQDSLERGKCGVEDVGPVHGGPKVEDCLLLIICRLVIGT